MVELVEVSLLHFEAIGVGPEGLVGIETVEHFPGYDDIFALKIVMYRYWIKFNLELNDLLECLGESDLNDGLFVSARHLRSSIRVVIDDGPLLEEVSFLVGHILVELTVLMWQRISPLRSENIGAFRISKPFTGLFRLCQISKIDKLPVDISVLLLHGVVFLEVHSESLLNALTSMVILEENLSFFREALNRQTSVQVDVSVSILFGQTLLLFSSLFGDLGYFDIAH